VSVLWVIVAIVAVVVAWKYLKRTTETRAAPAGRLEGPGTYSIEVVGESHYQEALENICDGRTEDSAEKYCQAALVLEDWNTHDDKAVRVDIERQTVGYLTREVAREYRKRLREAGHPDLVGVCGAVIRGGWDRGGEDRGHFGFGLIYQLLERPRHATRHFVECGRTS